MRSRKQYYLIFLKPMLASPSVWVAVTALLLLVLVTTVASSPCPMKEFLVSGLGFFAAPLLGGFLIPTCDGGRESIGRYMLPGYYRSLQSALVGFHLFLAALFGVVSFLATQSSSHSCFVTTQSWGMLGLSLTLGMLLFEILTPLSKRALVIRLLFLLLASWAALPYLRPFFAVHLHPVLAIPLELFLGVVTLLPLILLSAVRFHIASLSAPAVVAELVLSYTALVGLLLYRNSRFWVRRRREKRMRSGTHAFFGPLGWVNKFLLKLRDLAEGCLPLRRTPRRKPKSTFGAFRASFRAAFRPLPLVWFIATVLFCCLEASLFSSPFSRHGDSHGTGPLVIPSVLLPLALLRVRLPSTLVLSRRRRASFQALLFLALTIVAALAHTIVVMVSIAPPGTAFSLHTIGSLVPIALVGGAMLPYFLVHYSALALIVLGEFCIGGERLLAGMVKAGSSSAKAMFLISALLPLGFMNLLSSHFLASPTVKIALAIVFLIALWPTMRVYYRFADLR